MSFQFPQFVVVSGEVFTLANGVYRGQNSGMEIPAQAAIDLVNAGVNDPPKQRIPQRGPYSGTITALSHWRPTNLCWNRPLNPAKNIDESDPSPPLGWETEDFGPSRSPEVIERYSYP